MVIDGGMGTELTRCGAKVSELLLKVENILFRT